MTVHEALSRILVGWSEHRMARHPQDLESAAQAAQAAVAYYYTHEGKL